MQRGAVFFAPFLLIATSSFASPAIPIDPIDGILDAFKTHDVVALGEGRHGNQQGSDLRLKLIRNPRFPTIVNDIVVECGAGQHQDIADRFTEGKPVPDAELRLIWQDTTQAGPTCDRPIYQALFRTVRAINTELSAQYHLRVLLGDTPIDWAAIARGTATWERTDEFPSKLIEQQVLARHRRALIIYGEIHYLRKNLYWPLQDEAKAQKDFAAPPDSIVARLESRGAHVFSVWTEAGIDLSALEPDIGRWPRPSLALLSDTTLGQMPFTALYPHAMMFSYSGADGKLITEMVKADANRSPRIQDEFDALIYLGPPSTITMSEIPPSECADPNYLSFRKTRLVLAAKVGMADPTALGRACPNAK